MAGLEPEEAKKLLRRTVRDARAARTPRRRREAAQALAAQALAVVDELDDVRSVAAYVSRDTEPGTGPLLDALQARGIRVILPVLGPGLRRQWAEYTGWGDLAERAPGRPLEPSGPSLPTEAVEEADLVIAPGLAVDESGVRLGQGAGWYDRILPHVRDDAEVHVCVYDDEVLPAGTLPWEEHDILVPTAITPTRRLRLLS